VGATLLYGVERKKGGQRKTETRKSELAGNEEAGQSDRDQIFEEPHKGIFDVQNGDQFSPDLVTGECSDHSAERAENRAND
jgi:hypothetical protein